MGLEDRAFWRAPLKSWLLRMEGWASQYGDGAPAAPSEDEWLDQVADMKPETQDFLGIAPEVRARALERKYGAVGAPN